MTSALVIVLTTLGVYALVSGAVALGIVSLLYAFYLMWVSDK